MPSVRLGEVLEVQSGFAFKTEYFTPDAEMPLIRIRDLPNASTEINYRGKYREEFIVEQGSYLIGMDGNFRCFRWQGPRALLNQRVCRLRNFNASVEPEYIYYGIAKKLREIEDTTSFVTVKHISAKQIQNIELPIPPLDEQRRIVDILSRAEGIVRLRREAQKKAAELIPALFLELFGDPVTNPKGWPVVKLGELAAKEKFAIKAGPFGSALKKAFYVPTGYKIYGQEQVIRDDLSYGDYYISEEKYRKLENCRLQAHDLLISLVGTFGKISIVPEQFEPGIINPRLMKITLDRSRALPLFMKALLTGDSMRERIESVSHGGTMSIVNVGIMKGLDIPVPPLDIQVVFERYYQDALSIQTQQVAATQKAEATFNALLHRTFA
ncbi:MAG: restriction endonuclease subunit S [Sulfuricella sp.]|nr:restriction endonuclease subunit S [Sulfuricella sp.]